MTDTNTFIKSIITHAESRYDPVKAHEYYLRTRELKGRRSVSDLGRSKKKRERWVYTKGKVEEERKEALIDAADANKQAVTHLRNVAEKRREEIREKLRATMARITSETKADREQISREVEAKIASVPEVPKGLSKEETAKLAAERREVIAKIRGEAKASRVEVSVDTKSERSSKREDIAGQRTQISEELKGSLEKAKEAYKATRERVKAKYEAELDREYNAARGNV